MRRYRAIKYFLEGTCLTTPTFSAIQHRIMFQILTSRLEQKYSWLLKSSVKFIQVRFYSWLIPSEFSYFLHSKYPPG